MSQALIGKARRLLRQAPRTLSVREPARRIRCLRGQCRHFLGSHRPESQSFARSPLGHLSADIAVYRSE
mgnify:CR=1 FL=1